MPVSKKTAKGDFYLHVDPSEKRGNKTVYYWSQHWDRNVLDVLPVGCRMRESPEGLPVVVPSDFISPDVLRELVRRQLPGRTFTIEWELGGGDEVERQEEFGSSDSGDEPSDDPDEGYCHEAEDDTYCLYLVDDTQPGGPFYKWSKRSTGNIVDRLPEGYVVADHNGFPVLVPKDKDGNENYIEKEAEKQKPDDVWALPA